MYKYFLIDITKARQFMRFLKKEKAYPFFIKAFMDKEGAEWREGMCLDFHDAYDFVGNAFAWDDTPQSADFWDKVDDKWHDECDSHFK